MSAKRHRSRAAVLAAAAAGVLIAACGSAGTAETNPTTAAAAATTTVAPTTIAAAVTTSTVAAPAASTTSSTSIATTSTTVEPDRPTILLVHGAFADPSSWDPVAARLRAEGFDVVTPVNPLRGPTPDSAAVRAALDGIDGDVIVVAHSYGGIPATNAAIDDPDVRALVYVAAYVPDAGETFSQIQELVPGRLTPDRLVIAPYTTPDGAESVGATINTDVFADLFAADLPAAQATALAGAQMPLDLAALGEPSGPPAWRQIPSWYLLADQDQIIPPELARMMATRAGATLEEVEASHAVLLSRPDVVAGLVARVADETS